MRERRLADTQHLSYEMDSQYILVYRLETLVVDRWTIWPRTAVNRSGNLYFLFSATGALYLSLFVETWLDRLMCFFAWSGSSCTLLQGCRRHVCDLQMWPEPLARCTF